MEPENQPSPQDLINNLREAMNAPHIVAEMDQKRAALSENVNQGLTLAALDMLSDARGNEVAQLRAIVMLKRMLHALDHQELAVMTVYLLQERIALEALYRFDSDLIAAIADWFGESMAVAEEFVASDGNNCFEDRA